MTRDNMISKGILTLAAQRGMDKTICPSEVARHIAGQDEDKWRPLMDPIRAEAITLARDGSIEIRQGGKAVDLETFTGIYRIAILQK